MRLEKAVFHNIGPFDHAEIDLESLGDDCKLVALRGVNGAGKTFSLQAAIAGAAYRKMPTQGTLVGRAKARDSYVESTLVNGARWVVRHDLDAVSRKGEVTVRDAAGEPAYKGTSVKLFDAWSAKHFTAQDVLFATSFAVQKSGGFVDLGSSDRISVILQVVGVARIERMAAANREQAKLARHEFEKLDARLTDERARSGDLVALRLNLEQAQGAAVAFDKALEEARIALDLAVNDAREAETRQKAYDAAVTKRTELTASILVQQEAIAKLESRIRNNRDVLTKADEIHQARAELDVLAELDPALVLDLAEVCKPFNEEAAALALELSAQQQVVVRSESEVSVALGALDSAKAAVRAAGERVRRARERLVDEPKITDAAVGVLAARLNLEQAQGAAAATEAALSELRSHTLVGAEGRIIGLRGGLEKVRAHDGSNSGQIAVDALHADDTAASAAVEVPARVAKFDQRLVEDRRAVAQAERAIADLERLAARVPEITAARAELAAALTAEQVATQGQTEADTRHADFSVDLAMERSAIAKIQARQEAAKARRAELEPPARQAIEQNQAAARARRAELVPLAAKYEHLVAADARLAELSPQLETAQAELVRLQEQDSATPAPLPPQAAPDVAAYRATLDQAERAAKAGHAAAVVAEQRLSTAEESHARLTALQVEVDAAASELADWNLLAQDFGRDGLQSAEVDSAGPELTELTNDLLHNCHGPQFTVSIETSRLSSDGKDQIEECRVQVIDSIAGREGEAREFSGGQSVIIGEAISLALTMLACQRAGLRGITLVRDESGAALDPIAGRAYMKMLRRAADFVDASRVLLVTHSEECAEMCDARILIQDGKISHAA